VCLIIKDEELYEDLPGGDIIQEELYDSIEPYQQERLPPPPKQAAPSTLSGPPLPARNDPPSLPPRNQLSTTLSGSHTNSVPPPPPTAAPPPPPPVGPPHPPPIPSGRGPPSAVPPPPLVSQAHNPGATISAKDVNRLKPVKNVKPPKKEVSSSSGIDMKTIQQEALKKRGQIDLEALEKKNRKEDENSNAPPPWAGQLKKRKPVDTISNTSTEDREEENIAPWVRSKRGSFSEDAPAWVRKRLDSQNETTPPPVAKKPIKEKISEEPTINGNIDSTHVPKPAIPRPSPKPPHLSPKPTQDSGIPPIKPKPPGFSKSISPKPSPTIPRRTNNFAEETEKVPHTLPRAGVPKKLPPPKPPRSDAPFSPTENEVTSNVANLGPPKFTPELPPTPPFAQAKETVKPPALPKRMPPPTTPAPPPPSNMPLEMLGPPPYSPPGHPPPPPSHNLGPPPPTSPVSPSAKNSAPPLPVRLTPVAPLHVPQPKRFRRRSIPFHDAYTSPGVPDRATKPGRTATSKLAPAPPVELRPPIQAPVVNKSVPSLLPKIPPIPTIPSLPQKAAPPPPPPDNPEEYESEDFYDDVDTVKKAIPSANIQNSLNVTGVTTTEST